MKSKSPLRRRLHHLALLILLALWQIGQPLRAANLTWDISPGNGAAITGGTGTWTHGLGNWNTGAGDTTWNNATPDAATFGGTAGTVTLGGAVTVGNITINTANYIIAGGGNTLTLSNSTIAANQNATISADLGGTTGLIKTGGGILTLSGANNHTGATTLTAGTLSVGASNNLGNAASNLVFDGGTLQITGTALTAFSTIGHTVSFNTNKAVGLDINNAANTFTVDQSLNQGNGGFAKAGAGAAILSQANTYTGITTVSAGSLAISGSGTLGATTAGLTMGGGSLNLGGTSQTVGAVNISAAAASGDTIANGTLTATSYAANNAATAIISANLNGAAGLSKSNGGTLKLSGTNAYSGVTSVSAGVLQFANTASLYNSNTASWTKTNITANSGGTLAFNVGGAGEFTTGNVTTLLGNLTTGINNNGLRAGSAIGFDTTNAAGSTFTVADVIANSTGTGSGTVGLNKLGTNTLVLSNANTYTGATTITGGTLQVDGSIAAGAGLTVGSGATLSGTGTVNRNVSVPATGTINLGVGGTINGTLYTEHPGNGIIWTGAGSVTGLVTLFNGATLTVSAGDPLNLNGGLTINGFNGGMNVNRTVNLFGSSSAYNSGFSGGGTGVINQYGSLALGSGHHNIFDQITVNNYGATTASASGVQYFYMYNGVTFNNTATGSFTLVAQDYVGALLAVGVFNNAGTFTSTGSSLGGGSVIGQFNNSGTVNVSGSSGTRFRVTQSTGTSTGTFNVANGTTLSFVNGPTNYAMNAGTAFTGTGTLEIGNTAIVAFNTPIVTTVNLVTDFATMNLAVGADFTTTGTMALINGGSINGTNTLTAASYALSGGTVNANLGAGPMTVSGNTTLNGTAASSTVALTAGTLTLGASNRLNDAATVTLTGGTLAIGANSDTVGAVVLSSGSITGSTGVLTSASTFDVRSGSATAKLGGSVGLTKTTTGSVTLSGGSTYTGPTTVSDGTLAAGVTSVANVSGAFGNNSALSIANVATAGVNITGFNTQIGSLTGGGTTGGNVTLGAATLTTGGDNTSPAAYGGIIAGTGGLTKIGTGTQTLNGANTFSGTATVTGGVLRLDGATSLPGGTDTTVGVGESRLTLNGGVLGLGAGDFTRALGTGAGQVQITAGGGGFAAYGAPRNVNLGGASAAVTWNTGSFVPTGSNLILSAADATDTVTFQNPINLGAAVRTVQVNDGASAVDAVLSGTLSNGGLTKTGTGTLLLTTGSSYASATTVSQGTLEVTANNALGTNAAGTSVTNGAALKLTNVNYSTAEAVSINGTGIANGGALVNSGTSTLAGQVTAATNASIHAGGGTLTLTGGLVKNGTTATIMGGGRVNISGTGISGASANSDLVVDGTTLVVSAASNYNGPTTVQNSGTFVANAQIDTTTMTVSSNSTLSGTGKVIAAANNNLYLNGNFVVGDSTLGVPVASVLELRTSGTGSTLLGSTGTMQFDLFQRGGDLSASVSAADYVKLYGALDATPGGTLAIGNPMGITGFALGDKWKLFDLISGPGSISGTLALDYSALSLGVGLAGDFDRITGEFSIVPEPSRAMLLMLGMCGMLHRRRRTAAC